jgi:hypothetical protein
MHPPTRPSVAGEGVLGPCGPRTGNSSGVRPGNSSGLGGAPGSCIGGGTSGRGFPGGLSCGGSIGRPGLIGGSSCGSIGICIYIAALRLPPISAVCIVCGIVGGHIPLHCYWSDNGAAMAMFQSESSATYREPSTSMVLLRVLPVSA